MPSGGGCNNLRAAGLQEKPCFYRGGRRSGRKVWGEGGEIGGGLINGFWQLKGEKGLVEERGVLVIISFVRQRQLDNVQPVVRRGGDESGCKGAWELCQTGGGKAKRQK